LKKAYRQEAEMIARLNGALAMLQRGMTLQKIEDDQNLNRQVKSWSDYHNRVVAIIGVVEKEGCTPQVNSKLDSLRNAP
jgi:hypothetical protein